MKHLDMQFVENKKSTRSKPLPPSTSFRDSFSSADKLMMLSCFFGLSVVVGTIVYVLFKSGVME